MSEARINRVERVGLTFDVVDEGPLDGEPIVLLHGFPERATSWRHVAPVLNAAGYRTLAMDQRGYSPGARPKRRRDYRIEEIAADTRALIEAAGGSAHLVGHDWGAIAAWTTTMRYPDAVRTLTAVSVPHPGAFFRAMMRSSQGIRSWYMGFFQLPLVPEKLTGSRLFEAWGRKGGMTEDDVARFREEIVEDGALTTALNWYRALPFNDPRASQGKVTVPTTLVWSTEDLFLHRWGVERTEAFVDAPYELVILEGVSHWVPTQAPDALADAILARVRGEAV